MIVYVYICLINRRYLHGDFAMHCRDEASGREIESTQKNREETYIYIMTLQSNRAVNPILFSGAMRLYNDTLAFAVGFGL